jgi:type VI secretion system protein ImpH
MAGSKRIADPRLVEHLRSRGHRFNFFHAVDLVERMSPDAVPVGYAGPASLEALRFEHDPELRFHASDIRFISPAAAERGTKYTVIRSTFLGLFGVVSPMPTTMTEDVLADDSEQAQLREFYDLFHHRIIALFFRAWQKHRFSAGHRLDAKDPFTKRAMAMVGVDLQAKTQGQGLPPFLRLGLAPIFSRRVRSADALAAVAARLLPNVPARVESFVLRRTTLLPEQRATLGVRNMCLGRDMAIGHRVADRGGRFRIVFGPMSQEQADALAPGGAKHAEVSAIAQHFAGGVLEAEIELIVAAREVPRFRLGDRRAGVLGKSTRLGTSEPAPLHSRYVL